MALRWPLPAALAWLAAWALFAALRSAGVAIPVAIAAGAMLGAGASFAGHTPWRRLFIAAGFPLSLAASGLALGVPAWAWLAPLALLLLVYPLRAWRDAPLFPTPAGALDGLALLAPLRNDARVLDGGCGLGDGLRELNRQYPWAQLTGIEFSRPLAALCALRCRFARIVRGDLWAADWSGYDLVYLFQRPESMERAASKARRELKAGAWLVSLEFAIDGWPPVATLDPEDGKRVYLYRVGGSGAPQSAQ